MKRSKSKWVTRVSAFLYKVGAVLLPSILAAFSAVWIFSWQADYQQQLSFKNDLIGKTVEVLYQVEALAEELVEKYDLQCEVDRLIKSQGGYDLYRNTKLSKEDRARLVSLTTEANIQLGKLFVFVPDTTYEFVHDAVPTAKGSLRDFRDFALLALRKGLNPGTKFKSREDIRSYSFGKTECHENK